MAKNTYENAVQPLGSKIQIETMTSSAGVLTVHTGMSIQEMGTVIAVGPDVTSVKIGDQILFKAWAVDFISVDKDKYYFLDEKGTGLCAIV